MKNNEELVSQRELIIIGVTAVATAVLVRAVYRRNYVKIEMVNRNLERMFENGLLTDTDGTAVIPQFFRRR